MTDKKTNVHKTEIEKLAATEKKLTETQKLMLYGFTLGLQANIRAPETAVHEGR